MLSLLDARQAERLHVRENRGISRAALEDAQHTQPDGLAAEVVGSTVTLSDDSSTNGTMVNGVRIEAQALSAGDVITLGSQSLRFDP